MMLFEVNDIIFLVKSLNCITSSFNILNYVSFCEHGTRSSTHHTLKQSVSCTNKTKHFYFNRLPCTSLEFPTNYRPQSTTAYHNLRVETISGTISLQTMTLLIHVHSITSAPVTNVLYHTRPTSHGGTDPTMHGTRTYEKADNE